MERIDRWLERPRAVPVIAALALLLALPSLAIGFYLDDYVMVSYLDHRFSYSAPWWDLYRLTPRGLDAMRAFIASGETPWWTAPQLNMHFVRPLPSALMTLDHAIFGHAPLGWHLHSLAWYAALLSVVAFFFRRVLPRATATLALLVFALSDANVFPFAWPSARYGLVAATFATLGVTAHVRFRRDGWEPGRWLGPIALVGGLLASEGALGGVAFAVAYDLVGPTAGRSRDRVVRAVPFVVLACAYLAVYSALGGGARGSAAYVSPLSEPGAFLAAAVTRFPVFLADAILGVPADLSFLGFERVLAVAGGIAALGFAFLWLGCARLVPEDERAALRWLGLGSVVAMAAGVGGLPGSRELLVANLGLSPILAVLFRYGFAAGRFAWPRRLAVGLLALAHVGLAPIGQLGNVLNMRETTRATEDAARSIVRVAEGAGRIFVVTASDPMASWYPQAVVASESTGPLACWSWLSGAQADVVLTRTGARSFTLEPRGTTFLRAGFETLERSPDLPFQAGDEVTTCGARVRVVSVDGGRPARIEVTSDGDLETPGTAWLAWDAGAMRRVAFPPPGGLVTIPWTPGPSGMF